MPHTHTTNYPNHFDQAFPVAPIKLSAPFVVLCIIPASVNGKQGFTTVEATALLTLDSFLEAIHDIIDEKLLRCIRVSSFNRRYIVVALPIVSRRRTKALPRNLHVCSALFLLLDRNFGASRNTAVRDPHKPNSSPNFNTRFADLQCSTADIEKH